MEQATTSSGGGVHRDVRIPASLHSFVVISAVIASLGSIVSLATAEDGQNGGESGRTGRLEIEVLELSGNLGLLSLALLDDAESFENDGQPFRIASVPIENGRAVVVLSDLPFGTYAAKVFQDENSNGELDSNFVGYPTEAFGFSNDAMGRFGPPNFDQAKFEFDSGLDRIRIHAR